MTYKFRGLAYHWGCSNDFANLVFLQNYHHAYEMLGNSTMCIPKFSVHGIGVVTALLQRLLFTSVVHVACCDMHNGSDTTPVLRCWEGSTFSSAGGSSTFEVRPPKSFHLVPSWFYPQVLLFTRLANSYFVFSSSHSSSATTFHRIQ